MSLSSILSLRNIRRLVAIPYFLILVFIFIDFSNTLSSDWIRGLLFVQFTPSLIQFLKFGGLLATGFLLVLFLTLLFGRIYCSALCPLGILQDIITRLRPKRPRFKYFKPWNWFRYSLLAIVTLSALLGWLFLLNVLDPYSLAGRIFSDFFRPVYYWLNNVGVKVLGLFNSYYLHEVSFITMPWKSIIITAIIFVSVIVLAWRFGRLFCNTLCPVGALLGLVSKFSIFKLVIDKNSCSACKRCVRDCKASCIDVNNKQIDFSRCVACYNCIGSCNENGIKYRLNWKKAESPVAASEATNDSRRAFFATAIGLASSAFVLSSISALAKNNSKESSSRAGSKKNSRKAPITPPGSNSFSNFNSACTACHLCVSVCPTHVIQPSVTEYGFWGIMQPHMDFHSGFCNFECTKCGEVCPTGAIRPLELETKKRTQLGIARFHRGNCIVHVDRTECGACSEHCPTKAVHMVHYHGLLIPEVRDELCIGCGACEYACPTTPYKAIYINGNGEHAIAELPEDTDEGPRKSTLEDFPF